VKADGSVITWGNRRFGGDSSAVREQLADGVQQVTGSEGAFAAVKGSWWKSAGSIARCSGQSTSVGNPPTR
jgi:hypothetical protein